MSASDLTPAPRAASRVKWLAAVIVLAAFGAGLVTGFVADRIVLFHHDSRIAPAMLRTLVERIAKRLDRRLDLTPQQSAQVRDILHRHQQNVERLWSTTRPQVDREIDGANAEIRAILTSEQQEKFDRLRMRIPRHQ